MSLIYEIMDYLPPFPCFSCFMKRLGDPSDYTATAVRTMTVNRMAFDALGIPPLQDSFGASLCRGYRCVF